GWSSRAPFPSRSRRRSGFRLRPVAWPAGVVAAGGIDPDPAPKVASPAWRGAGAFAPARRPDFPSSPSEVSMAPYPLRLAVSLVGVAVVGWPASSNARIPGIEITRVESPMFGGASFGAAGQYEKLAGRAYGEVDPADPRNAGITDIGLAPRNAGGKVEY